MHVSIFFPFITYVLHISHADSDSFGCGVSNLAEETENKKLYPVEAGNFPWYTIVYHRKNGSDVLWQKVCSGTLITPQAVVTAALCLHQKTPQDVQVALGKLRKQWNDTEPNEIKREVKVIHIHEGYKGNITYLENNIGVLILSSEVPVSSFACLASNAESLQASQSQLGYVVGWNIHYNGSLDGQKESANDTLSYARVAILQHSACDSFFLPPDVYCNSTELIPHGEGNVGSGLTFASDGHHYLYGVVALLFSKDSLRAGTYVNVSYHYNWISNHIS